MNDATSASDREVSGKQSLQPMLLSIVLPVRNRPEQLRDFFKSLARQTLDRTRYEVLVCDDGSQVDLGPVVQNAVQEYGLRVLHLRQAQHGPARARNLGLAHARGTIVAFTDSDCLPEPNWLEELARAFAEPEVGLVGGRVDYRYAEFLSGRCVNFLMSSMLGAAGARNPQALLHMKFYPRTCNLAVRREIALKVNGFPDIPADTITIGEDLEFSHRVMAQGAEARYLPGAVVQHNEKRTIKEILHRSFQRGWTRLRLGWRIGVHEPIHALPAALVLYLGLAPLLMACWPNVRPILVAPGVLYLMVLLVLALQGAWAIRSLSGLLLVPVYAFLMHLGYGLGYLMHLVYPLGTNLLKLVSGRQSFRAATVKERWPG